MNQQKLLEAVRKASAEWVKSFNAGDAMGCTAHYETDAIMHARPFGTFTGSAEILAFWENLIDGGFSGVEYVDPQIEVVDENSAILTSAWKMNKAAGVVHKELWVLQADGSAKLRYDDFEAQG